MLSELLNRWKERLGLQFKTDSEGINHEMGEAGMVMTDVSEVGILAFRQLEILAFLYCINSII